MSSMRYVGGSVAIAALVSAIGGLGRATAGAPFTPVAILVAGPGAAVLILALGSLYEWIVHRWVYHGPSPVPLLQSIHEIHVRGHHWHRFPPDRYVEAGLVERIPVIPADPFAVCSNPRARWIAWAGQYALYLTVGIPFAFLPIWFLTGNPLFTASAVVSGMIVCYFFIKVHDVIHYPANRWIERHSWFRFLDRHHYIHHIDNHANINFLLPLCDWLFGTLKLQVNSVESRRWPAFEHAKRIRRVETPDERRGETPAAGLSPIADG
jgi:hypothetical protein